MLEERLSLAPMMDVTDAHFRRLLRIMTKKTVLYSEMVVDDTINHSPNLEFCLGRHPDLYPSVIQLGGSNPETLGQAAELCGRYDDGYAEINLNAGCPSSRVSKRCFGAQLMLKPDLVREIVHNMSRRSTLPVSVKCRLGVSGQRDKYEELVEFITAAHAGGAQKFIVHSRDCVLEGLSTKQNRSVPPLRYDVVHRLVQEFPDLTFVLNGGIHTLAAAHEHLVPWRVDMGSSAANGGLPPVPSSRTIVTDESTGAEERAAKDCRFEGPPLPGDPVVLPPVHGVMIGRAVAAEPVLFCTVDSDFYHVKDPCRSRRDLLEQYCDYCDWIQGESGPRRNTSDGKTQQVSTALLTNAMRNVMCGTPNNRRFLRSLNDVYVERINTAEYPQASDIIREAIKCVADEHLDAPLEATGKGKAMV